MKLILPFMMSCVIGVLAGASEDPFFYTPEERRWEPEVGAVYLQESGRQVLTEAPVTDVAVREWADGSSVLYFVSDGALFRLLENHPERVADAPDGVQHIFSFGHREPGALWCVANGGLFRWGMGWRHVAEGDFIDLTWHQGAVHVATTNAVYRYDAAGDRLVDIEPEGGYLTMNTTYHLEDGSQVMTHNERFGPLTHIASYGETMYGLRPGNLVLFDGEHIDPTTHDWGVLPSKVTRDLLPLGHHLFIATDRGVGVLRGMSLTTLDGPAGLPYEDTTCLAEGFDGELWIGSSHGAMRWLGGEEFHYFQGQRWLPDDQVHAIAADTESVYIATAGGLGIIDYRPYTLRKKADYYEQRLDAWEHKRMGFTHKLHWNDALGYWTREISDNDGGFTGHYLVAMSYKYAVTGDSEALEEANNTFLAIRWLETVTPMEGFPARAIWSVGDDTEKSTRGSGGLPARWNPTPDGNFEWKGDTSSDEVGAHFYAVAVYHDLAAEGVYKEMAKEHIDRLATHIIENGWKLINMDGELTRWGRWNPEYLLQPYGYYARGLNGMEAQSYAMTALGITGEQRFQEGLDQLLEWGYHHHTLRQKITFPPNYITPWDDRLAFLAYYPLLKYNDDPHLRSIYRRSLDRSWEIKRIEENAWYNLMYGILTGNEYEQEASMRHLREWPLDLIEYSYQNSHRHDLHAKPGYTPYAVGPRTESPRALSPRNVGPKKLDANFLQLDGGSGGRGAAEPNAWLESYWMARYYGLITAPDTEDPALLQYTGGFEEERLHPGAAPYDGPERPEIAELR